jgi:hypothetical protein
MLGLPEATAYPAAAYTPKLSLEGVGPLGIGVGANQFGAAFGGGVSLSFSDMLGNRGTVDCAAYWTGDNDLFSAVGTTRAIELARYDTVIHLRTPNSPHAYNRNNPLRLESIEEAAAIDEQIATEWSGHTHRLVVEPTEDFLHKAARVLSSETRCRNVAVTTFGGSSGTMARAPSQGPNFSVSPLVRGRAFAHTGAVDKRISWMENHANTFGEP